MGGIGRGWEGESDVDMSILHHLRPRRLVPDAPLAVRWDHRTQIVAAYAFRFVWSQETLCICLWICLLLMTKFPHCTTMLPKIPQIPSLQHCPNLLTRIRARGRHRSEFWGKTYVCLSSLEGTCDLGAQQT